MTSESEAWAAETFGMAELGDVRRTRRLVQMAATAADRPGGKVTQVFACDAARQGAYGLLEQPAVTPCGVARADHEATFRRVNDEPFVFVALDGSSLCITDRGRAKGTGRVGSQSTNARGFQVLSGVVVRADGTPVGLGAQVWWTRADQKLGVSKLKRKLHDKETRHWIEAMDDATARAESAGMRGHLWFLIDRGGDARDVLLDAVKKDRWITIRAAHNRRLAVPVRRRGRARAWYLWDALAQAPQVATYTLRVPPRPGQRARRTTMTVRACEVTLRLYDKWRKTTRTVTLWAVQAAESRPADRRTPLCWRLLTTRPVRTEEDACAVVFGYAQRWRVEEFHRAWKDGVCHVEDSELRSARAFQTWATLLASVAMRAVRLTYRAREEPTAPATVEFTPDEIDAVIVLRRPKGVARGATPSLEQVVRWVADLGGYTGRSSGGPPGATVIGRGLADLEIAVRTLASIKKFEK